MKIYTKTGDKGKTSLFDGTRVDKDSLRVEAYGTIDELSAHLGLAENFIDEQRTKNYIKRIQKKLFFVAGQLATVKQGVFDYPITSKDVEDLEHIIDYYLSIIDKNDAFIVQGTSKSSSALHVARTICRRAERRILTLKRHEEVDEILIKFVNRLSDTIYTLARFCESRVIIMDFKESYKESIWP